MTNRRRGLAVLAALLAGVPVGAIAQPSRNPRRIAYLAGATLEADKIRLEEFRRTLKSLGYAEGQNLIIDSRHEPDPSRLADLASELLRIRPELIVTVTTPATVAFKNVTRQIPIVFAAVGDPVAFGLVASLSRPGGNITGVANIASDLAGKRLELLKELLPQMTLVGVLLEPQTPVSVLQWAASEQAARQLGLRLHAMRIPSPDAYEAAFAEASTAGVTALAASLSPTMASNSARIARLAAQYRLPSISARSDFVDHGGLMAYNSSFETDGKAMARLVYRIFTGASPGDLPVEQPTEFELIINMKTARQLGLTVPRSMLLRASRVVE